MSDGYRFCVDRTGILLFSSALGETNPIYWDEEYAKKTPLGGVIAPPTFAVSSAHWDPNYALRGVRKIPAPPPKPAAAASAPVGQGGGGAGSGGGLNLTRILHGEQRFEYHKPVRPGMMLTVTNRAGKSWTKEGKKGGTMRFSESISEYRDEKGELMVTATSVGIVTEKAVQS
ncbi:MAG TPA: MaoC family dehydratase N-terminal domain-containing protein [Myxococcota bacterium]|nr:MaoC family dehydratase N-terminal domain-containing protein [Myxococcota bacterium]